MFSQKILYLLFYEFASSVLCYTDYTLPRGARRQLNIIRDKLLHCLGRYNVHNIHCALSEHNSCLSLIFRFPLSHSYSIFSPHSPFCSRLKSLCIVIKLTFCVYGCVLPRYTFALKYIIRIYLVRVRHLAADLKSLKHTYFVTAYALNCRSSRLDTEIL